MPRITKSNCCCLVRQREAVNGLTLKPFFWVKVLACGFDVAVAEQVLDSDDVGTFLQEPCGIRMAELVECGVFDLRFLCDNLQPKEKVICPTAFGIWEDPLGCMRKFLEETYEVGRDRDDALFVVFGEKPSVAFGVTVTVALVRSTSCHVRK